MTNEHRCILADKCKFAGDGQRCNDYCFPFRKAHGESGDGGILGLSNIPKKYRGSKITNLPIKEDNPETYKAIELVCKQVETFIDEGNGLYLYSTPNKDNPKGTGTGKTTSACTIANTYISTRIIKHVKNERAIDKTIPVLFVKMSKLQNMYNDQFRGTRDSQELSGDKFKELHKKMVTTDLLIVDDIGLRASTESFTNVFYEIIDERATEERATIYTSNVPLEEIGSILSEQIASRIYGTTAQLDFQGKDHRRGGIFGD